MFIIECPNLFKTTRHLLFFLHIPCLFGAAVPEGTRVDVNHSRVPDDSGWSFRMVKSWALIHVLLFSLLLLGSSCQRILALVGSILLLSICHFPSIIFHPLFSIRHYPSNYSSSSYCSSSYCSSSYCLEICFQAIFHPAIFCPLFSICCFPSAILHPASVHPFVVHPSIAWSTLPSQFPSGYYPSCYNPSDIFHPLHSIRYHPSDYCSSSFCPSGCCPEMHFQAAIFHSLFSIRYLPSAFLHPAILHPAIIHPTIVHPAIVHPATAWRYASKPFSIPLLFKQYFSSAIFHPLLSIWLLFIQLLFIQLLCFDAIQKFHLASSDLGFKWTSVFLWSDLFDGPP